MTSQALVVQYIQTVLFLALGVRAFLAWRRGRDLRARHLAVATILFAANSLLSAINATVFDASLGQTPPRWDTIIGSTMLYLSIYFFLRFLAEFVTIPRWILAAIGVLTLGNIVLAAIEQPEFRFDPKRGLVDIPGVSNPIDYRAYIGYVLAYLALAFGVMFLSFLIFGLRVHGLARFRMLCISGGFFLLFVVIGLIPRLLFGDPSARAIADLLEVVRFLALGSAPLLLIGFAPPRWIVRRFSVPSI